MAVELQELWFTVRPIGAGPPAEVRIRRMLKEALRQHGLQCTGFGTVPEHKTDGRSKVADWQAARRRTRRWMNCRILQMSSTLTDLGKVTQMLDIGWRLEVFKGELGSYVVIASHPKASCMERVKNLLDDDGELVTDDFTPEQALTRMAYKIFGIDLLGSPAR